jgi:hypothetical protein
LLLDYAFRVLGLDAMKPAALGFRVHSGWSALVAISLEKGLPRVLLRERPRLVENFTFEFRQPYHTAKKKPVDEAGEFIARVRTEARGLAFRAVQTARESVQKHGYEITRGALLVASGKPLPALAQILASHALIHSADGELFREAVLHACEKCGLETYAVKEKEVQERAGQALRLSASELAGQLADLGRTCGSPWTLDEKLAVVAAWLAMMGPGESALQS